MNVHKMMNESTQQDPQEKTPSNEELYKLIKDLTYRCELLEGKIQMLTQNNCKINNNKNNIKKLNNNPNSIKPAMSFEAWCKFNHSPTYKNQKIIQLLLDEENSIQSVFQSYLQDKTVKTDPPLPIQHFVNPSHFYVFKEKKWEKMCHPHWCALLQSAHSQILKIICEWKTQNADAVNQNEKINEAYNKMLIKFMGANITSDSFIASIKKNWA
jgi:hypothetical protein